MTTEELKKYNEEHKIDWKLPSITAKFKELSLGNQPRNKNTLEIDFNNRYLDIVEKVRTSFLQIQKDSIEEFIHHYTSGNLPTTD